MIITLTMFIFNSNILSCTKPQISTPKKYNHLHHFDIGVPHTPRDLVSDAIANDQHSLHLIPFPTPFPLLPTYHTPGPLIHTKLSNSIDFEDEKTEMSRCTCCVDPGGSKVPWKIPNILLTTLGFSKSVELQ